MNISFEEVLSEIQKMNDETPDGFTSREMSKKLGMSQAWCQEKIADLIEEGVLKFNGKRKEKDSCERPCYRPVYVYLKND